MAEITAEQRMFYIETAQALKGSERRLFIARVVQSLGRGGQRFAERTFGWNRRTVRKGMAELTSGIRQVDRFSARGRKRVEERLPHLLADLGALVECHYQNGATRVRADDLRQQLIELKGYTEAELPSVATIRKRLKELSSH